MKNTTSPFVRLNPSYVYSFPFFLIPAVPWKGFGSADCGTIYTIYLFLCTQPADSSGLYQKHYEILEICVIHLLTISVSFLINNFIPYLSNIMVQTLSIWVSYLIRAIKCNNIIQYNVGKDTKNTVLVLDNKKKG